jgi:FkbM family methyltransferase
LVACGAYGEIEGAADDGVVFGRYCRTGSWSPDVVALLTRVIGARGTLLDVGAHIGLVSIAVARAGRTRCLAFEPAPANYALLRRNCERQGLDEQIETHALALDADTGTSVLGLSADNSGDHRLLHQPGAHAGTSVVVHSARLDDVLKDRALPSPIALKLDTQGAELRVLRGALHSLQRIDYALIEYWPAGLHRMGDRAEALRALLCEHFPFAAVLDPRSPELTLNPVAYELDRLGWIASDGSDPGFFDVLLSKQPQPPG